MNKTETEGRQLFIFWQFNGDNSSWCNLKCPYCYGGKKQMRHYWNGDIKGWEQAFMRVDKQHGDAGIYFVMSYGESMGGKGFYECVDMIGAHPTWTLCIVTNFMLDPSALLASKLAKEGRLFITASWHPLGVPDRVEGWKMFKQHISAAKQAGVPVQVMYCFYKPQIKWYPEYFRCLEKHGFRMQPRKYIGSTGGKRGQILRFLHLESNQKLGSVEQAFLEASTCPKVVKYRVKNPPEKSTGKLCSAGKDLILVKYNGDVSYCADCCNSVFGNIFGVEFQLKKGLMRCLSPFCGGDYGMLHLVDSEFGTLPERLGNDNFVSIVEGTPPNHNRALMLKLLEEL